MMTTLDVVTFFLFTAPASPEIYTLSLHDALPICGRTGNHGAWWPEAVWLVPWCRVSRDGRLTRHHGTSQTADRKSTRLNSSHGSISYAVFCLKKKKKKKIQRTNDNRTYKCAC